MSRDSYSALFDGLLGSYLTKVKEVTTRHQQTCPDCKRELVNIYKQNNEWKCRKCWSKIQYARCEIFEPIPQMVVERKLIKTWAELKECTSETHILEIEDGCGWIHPKEGYFNMPNGSHYLSTHTFYGGTNLYSTELLQACGFNVEIASWDELGW